MHVAIAGSGPAGMTAALLLARSGHRITLIDRDPGPVPGQVWGRVGVMQFHLPHGFRHQSRCLLADRLPDVLDAIVAAGAELVLPPGAPPEQTMLRVRRSVWERALWECATVEPGITRVTGHVDAVEVEAGRAVGLVVDSAFLAADLVVDAAGRAGTLSDPYRPAGRRVETGMAYASRIYRLRPGQEPGPCPSGGIAVMEPHDGFMVLLFPHDAGTFSVLFVRPTADRELVLLRHQAAFEAACRAVPVLAAWTDPARSVPIDAVRAGAGLANEFVAQPTVTGLVAIGDAVCTTNPAGGRGITLGLLSAAALADLLAEAPDGRDDLAVSLDAWAAARLRPWFEDHLVWDASLLALWAGEPVSPDGPLGLDVLAAAAQDGHPEWMARLGPVFGMLATPDTLDGVRAEVRAMITAGWQPPVPSGLTRDQLAGVIKAALVTAA